MFETKTAHVGEDVTLTCNREKSWHLTNLFWIRLFSGTFPEILGGTYAHEYEGVDKIRHITAKQEPGTFVLKISKAQLSDTAIYYCIKVKQLKFIFLKGTFLTIKGPESDRLAVTQDPLSDPVRAGDSVTLQCSVLSDSGNKKCPEEHNVYWFKAKSDESHLSLIYANGNSSDRCEKSPETQKCVYNFFPNVDSSDAGTYYCAVATCGQIVFGNGTKLDIEGKR
ncbi:uncharacterized protein [Channa argus]|uniref:uncharacterized protein n=1 Tax=Channa argus TaxID=215402 RepID=UPI0035227628